jgi:hypothetical protein
MFAQPHKKQAKAALARLGADVREAFTEDCTHLVTVAEADFTTKVSHSDFTLRSMVHTNKINLGCIYAELQSR